MNDDNYNIPFERAILSSFIFEPATFTSTVKQLSRDHFYLAAHKDIFDAMKNLNSVDKPIDEEFLQQELARVGHFDERAMVEILTANPISNIQPYVDELKRFTDLRKLFTFTTLIRKAVKEEDIVAAKQLIVAQGNELTADKRLPIMSPIGQIDRSPAEFILKDWIPIPKNTVSFITAPGGSGKSWIVLQMAARYCIENTSSKAFLWLSEDPEGLSAHRFDKIMLDVLKASQSFGDRLQISNSPTPTLITEEKNRKLVADPIWYDLKRLFNQFDLIILDPLIAFFGGDENNNGHARFFMQLFTAYASENNKTIVFIHHSAKGTTGARGASAFQDAVRSVYEISKVQTKVEGATMSDDTSRDHQRNVRLTKDNYGASMIWGKIECVIDVFAKKTNHAEVVYEEKISLPYIPGDF